MVAMGSRNMVEVQDLVKRFGSLTAVDHVSFQIHEGEIFGILGPNGAGKTTIINMLFNLLMPTSGKIRVSGIDISDEPFRVKRLLGLMTQETIVEADLTARENLRLFCKLYEIPSQEIDKRVQQGLEDAGLVEFADQRAGTFSGGMQRRLGLVRALIQEPKILVLDEPTSGLDIQNRNTMHNRIRELNRKGATIILTTQYLEEADILCDRIAIIDHGKMVAIGTPLQIKETTGSEKVLELVVGAQDTQRAISMLKSKFGISSVLQGDMIVALLDRKHEREFTRISKMLDSSGITVVSRSMHPPTLNDVFVKLTGARMRDRTGAMRGGQASVRWK